MKHHLLLIFSALLWACSQPSPQSGGVIVPDSLPPLDTTSRISPDLFRDAWEQRRQNGDTLPTDAGYLESLLPQQLEGWEYAGKDRKVLHQPTLQFSEAAVQFISPQSDSLSLILTLTDHAGTPAIAESSFRIYNLGGGIFEGTEEKHLPRPDSISFASTRYNPAEKVAELHAWIGFRYHLCIRATGQSGTVFTETVWSRIPWKSLYNAPRVRVTETKKPAAKKSPEPVKKTGNRKMKKP